LTLQHLVFQSLTSGASSTLPRLFFVAQTSQTLGKKVRKKMMNACNDSKKNAKKEVH